MKNTYVKSRFIVTEEDFDLLSVVYIIYTTVCDPFD